VNGFDDLERKLDKLLKDPDNPQLFNEIGVLLYQAKDWENAELYLQRAYILAPSDKDIMYNYASLLYSQLKWQKAIAVFQDYLKLAPDDKGVGEKIADAYYQLGKYDLAAKCMNHSKKL